MTLNFYLDKKSKKSERTIFLYIRNLVPGKTLVIHSGEKIEPKYWDNVKQQAKRSHIGSPELNSYLLFFKEDVKRIVRTCLIENPGISLYEIKKEIINKTTYKVAEDTSDQFFKCFDEFIESQKSTKRHRTIQKYQTLRHHLSHFQDFYGNKLAFEKITPEFEQQFTEFMVQILRLTNNTIGKYVSTLKTFLNWAAERGKNKYFFYKKFKMPTEIADIIYLTEDELMSLYHLDLSKNKRLDQVRDVFCFGCFTGQRFSDISNIKRHDICDNFWKVHIYKTKNVIMVPLIQHAQNILNKYSKQDTPLPIISHQKTNEYLKELGRIIKLSELITIVRFRGSERIETVCPKYELLSTHTARRTFVTLSLEKGMRAETVMDITGHRSYKIFKKYIILTNKVKEAEMNHAWEI